MTFVPSTPEPCPGILRRMSTSVRVEATREGVRLSVPIPHHPTLVEATAVLTPDEARHVADLLFAAIEQGHIVFPELQRALTGVDPDR